MPKFVEAGYDLAFIQKAGLSHDDLDAIGIPALEKRGLRRKLIELWDLSKFYDGAEDEEGDEDDEDEDDEDEDDEDEDDEDDD